jgi:hypothetical protein
MRKATIGVLVVLALWGATSWQQQQPLPQWRVILEGHRMGGTEPFYSGSHLLRRPTSSLSCERLLLRYREPE